MLLWRKIARLTASDASDLRVSAVRRGRHQWRRCVNPGCLAVMRLTNSIRTCWCYDGGRS